MRRVRYIIISILLLLPSVLLFSRESLPKLPDDSAISRGTLPNGVSYFFVKNQAPKGVLDIALLQRACQNTVAVPSAFLARNGVAPGKKGYVEQYEGNTVYRFRDIQSSIGEANLDSLYYLIFRMIEASAEAGEPQYGTTDQTLIVSGDIDKATLLTKLKMLAMIVPLQEGPQLSYEYIWNPEDRFALSIEEDNITELSTIRFSYRTPALPRDLNNTVVPVVSAQMDRVFGTVLEGAMRRSFRNEGLHLKSVKTSYERGDTREGDNTYFVEVTVPFDEQDAAVETAHCVFKTVETTEISVDQFKWANNKVTQEHWVNAQKPVSNEEYVNRCLNSILYNASLATDISKVSFFRKRDLPDTARVHHYNRFARSLVGATEALDSIDVLEDTTMLTKVRLMSVNMADTLGFVEPQKKKTKVKSYKADGITGGNFLNFANGFTLLYKQMPTNGIVYFSWILKGGDPVAPIDNGNVGALTADSFLALAAASGIHMEIKTTTRDVRIEGSAPSGKQLLLAKTLITLYQSRPELGCTKNSLLVMVGDRTEYSVQKYWQMYVGGFDMTVPNRKRTIQEETWRLQPEHGDVLYSRLLSLEYPMSSENYMIAHVAVKALENELTKSLDGTGLYATVDSGFATSSTDKFNIYIRIRAIEGQTDVPSASQIRNITRGALSRLAKEDVNKTVFNGFKTAVINEMSLEQSVPTYWLEAARLRFTESKDFTSKYKDKVSTITPASVKKMYASMIELGTVEYLK